MTKNVLLCGVEGQGIVLISRLIALTAMEKGVETRRTETIGTAQRGGGMVNHARIDEEIHSPLIPHGEADVPIGFEPAEAVRCLPYLKKGGYVVVSSASTRPVTVSLTGGGYTGLKMMEYLERAADNLAVVGAASTGMACDSPRVMNVTLLGTAIISGLTGTSLEEIEVATEKRAPEKLKNMDMKALKLGVSAGLMIR